MDKALVVFQDKNIRCIWHDEKWYFSVVDVVSRIVCGVALCFFVIACFFLEREHKYVEHGVRIRLTSSFLQVSLS